MNWYSWLKRGVIHFAPLLPLLFLASLFVAAPVQAQGGLAISGSFYRQALEIPQGSSVSAPSIYVVVFNQSDEEFGVRMTREAPPGVDITLSEDDFTLQAGEQRKVFVEVEATRDATPGKYTISITAESYKEGVDGIQLMGAARQSAELVVLGESALVKVETASPDGGPVVAVVRLFKVIADQNYEFAYSEDGILETTVSPGDFVALAYMGSQKLAEESFSILADEEKAITLTVATVYFEGFALVPNYDSETGNLAFAEVVYTISNLYQAFPEGRVVLQVSHNGSHLEEVTLATLAPLEKGRLGLKYNYTPPAGWKQGGSYGFRLQLHIGGEVYSTTLEEELQLSGTLAASEFLGSWTLIGSIAGGAVLLFIVVLLVSRRTAGNR